MSYIVIHPFARKLPNGNINPKNYPVHYWKEVINELYKLKFGVIQIGEEGEEQLTPDFRKNLPLDALKYLLGESFTWIGIDSCVQHLAWSIGQRGICLFGKSDPLIFGHEENINLYVSRDRFREHQFQTWDQTTFDINDFVKPEVVIRSLHDI